MRGAVLPWGLLLAACASPRHDHGFDQRDAPARAFRSFQAAVAAGDHDREFEFLSERLRRSFGVRSRTEWKDARATVLTQGHRAIRGILRARIVSPAAEEPDGRVRLDVKIPVFLFAVSGQVWLRPEPILRVRVAGDHRPRIYLDLPGLELVPRSGELAVRVPEDWEELFEALEGERPVSMQAQVEWFLDDFVVGKASAEAAGREMEQKRK